MSQDIKKSSLHFEKKVLLWMKIMIWHTFQNPNMEFPDIFLTFAPFQNFPDIISNSLPIALPWKNKIFPDFSLTCGNPEFVHVPIDKAANNIGFICKKYFLEVLLQETKSNTYVPYQDSAKSIINSVAKKCLEIGIPVKEDNKTLPQIHAIIEMHKNPVKFRFIIGPRNCITQQVAKKLVKILQLIMKIHRKYCNKIKFYTVIER